MSELSGMDRIIQKARQLIRGVLSDRLVRRFLVSFVFGLLVILTYYLLRLFVPQNVTAYQQVVTVVFIIISVLILFPAREAILQRVLSRYEYLAYFGHDFHHLELMARHFSIDTLVQKIFPELTQWLGVTDARLAILDSSRKRYDYYDCSNGRLIDVADDMSGLKLDDRLIRFLKKNRTAAEVFDETIPEEIRNLLQKMQAVLILPFVYRKSLVGYLILKDHPRHPFADRALEFFGDKAAVAIQNNILSYRVIDSQLYDQELQAARRIQRTLHETRLPEISGYRIKGQGYGRSVLEFYNHHDGRIYLVVLSADRVTGAAGIVLYGLLGTLYAILQRETNIDMHNLLEMLRADPDFNRTEYRVDLLIAEIVPDNPRMMILMDGENYTLYDTRVPDRTMISRGWRNYVDIQEGQTYRLAYRNTALLSLEFSPDFKTRTRSGQDADIDPDMQEQENEWISG